MAPKHSIVDTFLAPILLRVRVADAGAVPLAGGPQPPVPPGLPDRGPLRGPAGQQPAQQVELVVAEALARQLHLYGTGK